MNRVRAQKDTRLIKREIALRTNLKKRKKFKEKIKKKWVYFQINGLKKWPKKKAWSNHLFLNRSENVNSGIVDPKIFKKESFVTKIGKECIIPPNSFALARTMEYFKIPEDVLVICLGKSTYARCGIIVNVTPLEPGWEGHVTLEFSNTTPLPAKIYANEGIAQFVFIKGNEKPQVTYANRNGKYMKQRGVTLPKI